MSFFLFLHLSLRILFKLLFFISDIDVLLYCGILIPYVSSNDKFSKFNEVGDSFSQSIGNWIEENLKGKYIPILKYISNMKFIGISGLLITRVFILLLISSNISDYSLF